MVHQLLSVVFQRGKLFIFLVLLLHRNPTQGFFTNRIINNKASRTIVNKPTHSVHCTKLKEKYDDNNDNKSFQERLDKFLDTPFFDPNDESSWFASWVKNDYETAEFLYVGIIFVLLTVFSQELLRMAVYGNDYIPFTRLTSPKLW